MGKPTSSHEPLLELSSAAQWSSWLRTNHARSTGVWLRLAKKGAVPSVSYAEALEAALVWGWIDSQKRALDETGFAQRFSPRKANSPWSKINRAKAEALIATGAMQPPGLAEVTRAKRDGRWERAYDGPRTATVPDDLAQALARNPRARAFFATLDGTNRFAILFRVQTASSAKTRAARIERFVELCARHETLHPTGPAKARRPAPTRAPASRRRT